ncbi:hypothetical protein BGZ97_009314 [Linnemannia gamsii]|uniref:HCP-like protein n=1 Tax=Linnemannia gamsii TaxID=64522 RepID=A0A9P6QQB4_9FUNG|nr:hypothetical protein BGZ97_009314 [Linnemannia gamsii]
MGVPKDYVKAMTWYRRAADQGNAYAQCHIGYMYDLGLGVPQDGAKAASWYRKSAEQGEAEAQYNLGLLYSQGRGVRKDNGKAMTWFKKAADQGDTQAKNELNKLKRQASTVQAKPPLNNIQAKPPKNIQADPVRNIVQKEKKKKGLFKRFNPAPPSAIFYLAPAHFDDVSGKDIILGDDILVTFKNVVHARSGAMILPFLKGRDFKTLDPLRIATATNITLNIVVADQLVHPGSAPSKETPNQDTVQGIVGGDSSPGKKKTTCSISNLPPATTSKGNQSMASLKWRWKPILISKTLLLHHLVEDHN